MSETRQQIRIEVLQRGRHVCFCVGGDAPDTSGQNEAARVNAEVAKEMWGEYKNTYMPMEKQFASEAFNYNTPEAKVEQAGLATADVSDAFANQRAQNTRNMTSMGLDPSSGAYANNEAKMRIAEAAASAGAQNKARSNVENMGYARKQDAISIGKGMPGQAVTSMANAGNQYAQVANQQLQSEGNTMAGVGAAAGTGAAIYKMMKDGGPVEKPGLRLAMGGAVGNPRMQQVMAQPNTMPVGGRTMNPAVSAGLQGLQTYKTANTIKDIYGRLTAPAPASAAPPPGTEVFPISPPGVVPEGTPLAADVTATASTDAATAAATDAATAAATDAAATTAAETTAAAAATETATAGAAAAAGETAIGAALASNPVGWALGAGLLASQLFKKDGGKVSRKDLRKGGNVKGPGTSTSDSIPAQLSDGEYVLNAAAVKLIGKPKLDKLNQAGLQRRYGLGNARRAA